VRSQAALDGLRQLLTVVVRHHALHALNELARDPAVVHPGIMGVEHTHAGTAERVLVEGRLVRIESAEAADVIAENGVSLTPAGIRAELEQREELAAALGVKTAPIIRKLTNDRVAVRRGPHGDLRSLLLDRKILMTA
jgi:hypothetical protein